MGAAGFVGGGFDHVQVDGALGEPVGVFQFGGFGVEDADDLALLLRAGFAGQAGEEVIRGVQVEDRHTHLVDKPVSTADLHFSLTRPP